MATHTVYGHAPAPTNPWYEAVPPSYESVSANELVYLEAGGFVTRLQGAFQFDLAGNLVGGTFANMTRTDLSGAIIYESITGIPNLSALNFHNASSSSNKFAAIFSGADTFTGGAGNDFFRGYGGVDTYAGGYGNDDYFVDDVNDTITEIENAGIDTVQTTHNAYTLGNNIEYLIFRGIGNFFGTGNDLDNRIFGFDGDDELTGGEGNDTLNGRAGQDDMFGGLGNDSYYVDNPGDLVEDEGGDYDAVYSSLSVYTLPAGIENFFSHSSSVPSVLVTGNALDNLFFGEGGGDVFFGLGGNDFFTSFGGANSFYGGVGNDTYNVFDANDFISEIAIGGGYDTIELNVATFVIPDYVEVLISETGFDLTVTGSAQANEIYTGYGDDDINGGAGNDWIEGGNGDDQLRGGADNDQLWGGPDNDLLVGGGGADGFYGGEGVDTAGYFSSFAGVEVRLTTGAGLKGEAEGDYLQDVENLTGSQHADILVGSHGVANVLSGGNGDDTLIGHSGLDMLLGGEGADLLDGGIDADVLNGGAGTDTASYHGSGSGVQARLSTGAGTLGDAEGDSYISIENVIGSAFADTLVGADGVSNRLEGGEGADTLLGRSGEDALLGGGGDDLLDGGADADLLIGGAGIDTASYAGSTAGVQARLTTGAGLDGDAEGDSYMAVENLLGSAFADTLVGSNLANNKLDGGNGNDTLLGNSGNDVLTGGLGKDTLLGGLNNDAFVFNSAAESAVGANRDVIYDFEDTGDNDSIVLTGFAGTLSFIGTAAFSAANQVRAVQSGADVLVQINTTGTSGAESEILLANTTLAQIDATDFFL